MLFVLVQWKKAGALDMSLKDWVILSADATRARGVAINRFGTPEFTSLESPVWADGQHDTSSVWADDAFMPGPQFPSDHVRLAAHIFSVDTIARTIGLLSKCECLLPVRNV